MHGNRWIQRIAIHLGMAIVSTPAVVCAIAKTAPIVETGHLNAFELRLVRLERIIASNQQLQLYRQISILQQEFAELRGLLERQEHAYQQVAKQQQQLEQRLYVLTQLKFSKQEATGTKQAVLGSTPLKAVEEKQRMVQTAQQAYDHAIQLILQKKAYKEALVSMEQFIQRYPQSTYLPNAHYWIGHLLLKQACKSEALHHFAIVVERFPYSVKYRDAMLQSAHILKAQGEIDKARAIYQRIVAHDPVSPEAERAKAHLKSLSEYKAKATE